MAYKYYNSILFLYLIGLIIFAGGIGYSFANQNYYTFTLGLMIELYIAWKFIHFLNKTHKLMNYFIHAIKNNDTTLHFPKKSNNRIINELHQSLNELNTILHDVQAKSKIKETYFSEILQHIATGVIVLTDKGFVTEVNSTALELTGLQTLTHISQLKRIDSIFMNALSDLKNHQKKVLDLITNNERIQVITRCTIIRLENEDVKLITMQDIRGELERKEIDSWVKLIRVLSHEIMNSLAPVTSISQSLKRIWEIKHRTESNSPLDMDVQKTVDGLGVICQTNEDLIHFVQSYRMLSKAPEPQLNSIQIHAFFDRLNILLSPIKESFVGELKLQRPKADFKFIADEQMMVQVIINLVKNAAEAFIQNDFPQDNTANIIVNATKKGEKTEIKISDNGSGIPDEISDEIFIPFFTTKENGSGIGLSHSRQILRAHGGSLLCQSKIGETVFTVRW
ncbi:PAS domain-containing protein [Ancylomarina euxinus]|uniref:histidine kinase n=1 Tax=Ancylomarina euxinus TaxID=2283627 RepID=A0A425Y7N9_9BACT|nr:ATP-binding protein [Ancylomarina euxinus]MCZ4693646.1 ATP-binding protein [Ancylomarina euxinus]MUP13875.1 PAS domain-containing protein [Ancylomarina euxinus]RRG24496.1 PAS domain-containing protein [Ancylomarina euxinus]